jgi:hypothetical protein
VKPGTAKALLKFGLCCGILLLPSHSFSSLFADEVLVNPGFETGALAPWAQARSFSGSEDWNVTSADAHTGTFSATDIGNKELKQTFAGVLVSDITQVSFWFKHPDFPDVFNTAYDFFYSDGSDNEFLAHPAGTGWNFLDVTATLTPGKTLVGFSVWGNSLGLGRALVDDLSITTAPAGTVVPEPTSILLLATVLGVTGGLIRRRIAR